MPTSILKQAGLRSVMQLAVTNQPSYRPNDVLIGPWSWCALGEELTGQAANNFASTAYPSANRIIAYPFAIADYFLVQKVWWVNGTTATTDVADVGVYSEAGTTLIVHASATVATANIVQEANPADTLLQPGRYWCAYTQNGTTATPMSSATPVVNLRAMGVANMAGSGGLGATFTPVAVVSAILPLFGIAGRVLAA